MELKISKLTKQFGDFTAVDCLKYYYDKWGVWIAGVNGAGKNHIYENHLHIITTYQRTNFM